MASDVEKAADNIPAEPKRSSVSQLLDQFEEEDRQRLSHSVSLASEKNPEEAARVLELSDLTGLTPQVVEQQLPEVEARVSVRQRNLDFVMREAPSAAQLLKNPDLAPVVHDDVDNIVAMERLIRKEQLTYRDKLRLARAKGNAIVDSSEIGMARLSAVLGLGPETGQRELIKLRDLEHLMEFEDDANFFAGIPVAAFEQFPILWEIVKEAGTVGLAVGAGSAAVTFAVTKQPAAAGRAFKFGFGIGAKFGAFGGAFELEAGLAFNEFIAADQFGNKLDDQSAAAGAVMVGLINASLEFASLRLLGKTFAGAKPLIRRQVRAALATRTGREIAKKVMAAYLASVAGEGITEGLQEFTNVIGQDLLQILDKEDFEAVEFEGALGRVFSQENLKRIGDAAVKGTQAGIAFATPGTVISATVQSNKQQTDTEREQETLDEVIELSTESKVKKRSVTVYRQLIRDAVEEAGVFSDVYITAAEVQTFLENEGVDLSDTQHDNPAIESMLKQLPEALAGGHDVVIPLEDFAAHVTDTEHFESLRAHIKLSAETATQDELSKIDGNLQERIKQLMEEAQDNLEILREAEEVYEDVKEQLIATDTISPESAAVAAEIIPAYVTTKAARTGISVREVYARMGLSIVGPEADPLEGGLEQADIITADVIQAKALGDVFDERESLVIEREETDTELQAIEEFLSKLEESGDTTEDAGLERRLSELIFSGDLPRNADLRFEGTTVIQRGDKPATPKKLAEQVRELEAERFALNAKRNTFDQRQKALEDRVDRIFSGTPSVFRQDRRGEIAFDEDTQGAVIRLTEAADLSTFLHEAAHLFLEMEKRFFNDPSITDEAKADGQSILDFLGVSNFDSIEAEHHEKWAVAFEAYLFEGKAPSAELRPVFRRFAAWLADIYKNLRNLQVKLTPEIRAVMDRMLATDEQIAEVQSKQRLEPLFNTAEEAAMTPEEFGEYKALAQGAAEERLRTKILVQLKRTTQKWWNEELEAAREAAREELVSEPLYRAIAFMRQKKPAEGFDENKMDRRTVFELLGLAVPKDRKVDPNAVDPTTDTLSQAIAKLGGLDRDEAELQGVDPAHWRPVTVTKIRDGRRVDIKVPNPDNMPLFGKPIFRATGGRTFDEMREILAEEGMDYLPADSTESDLLEKLLADLSGDVQYSLQVNFDLLFEDPAATPEQRRVPGQLRGLTKFNGAAPDTIAAIYGFRSGAELVRQIVESPTLNELADRRAQQTMVERHGDILNDGTLEQEALEASHNTEQGEKILAELRALSGQTDTEAISDRKAIKDAAEKIIGGTRISALRPAKYLNAATKAATEAQELKDAGNVTGAKLAKERQYLEFNLYRAAVKARDRAQALRRRGRQMTVTKYSDKTARPEYISRMKQLLALYDFRQSNKQARENAQAILENIKAWIEVQQTDPGSPANLVDVSNIDSITHYREMTPDQLEAVMDTAKSLLHAARANSKTEQELFKAEMRGIADNIKEVSTTTERLPVGTSRMKSVRGWGRAATASHRKLESLIRQLDGFVDLGKMWKKVVGPLLEANNQKLTMQLAAHDALNEIFEGHEKLLRESIFNPRAGHISFTFENGKSMSLSMGSRVSIALNWGNLGNRDALLNMKNRPFTEGNIQQVLDTLTNADWDLVESIWDYIDSFWPQIAELEKSFTGVVPSKVKPESFKTSSGRTIKGGYYPLKTDARLSFRGRQEEIEKRAERQRAGGVTRATTAHGHTIERTQFGGREIDLSINVLFNHVDNVIHDLSHRRAVRDADSVLRNRDIQAAAIDAIGQEAYGTLLARVTEVAAGFIHPNELAAIETGLRWARLALTYSALGFSMKSGFSQTLGMATAVGEFGAEAVAKGFADFYADWEGHSKFINERSVFMRERLHTIDRDASSILRSLRGKTKWNALRKNAFVFLLAGDRLVSRAVWWMAYNQGMERAADPNNTEFDTENDAINWADRAVSRTQQSGLLMDLASVESKNEFVKTWTVMYSAFSAIYQIATEQVKKYQLGKINAVQLTYNIAWILVIPALFEELLTGRDEDDDEDKFILNNRWTRAVASFSLGTMAFIREVGWIMKTGQASELPLQRVLTAPLDLATQIEQGEVDAAAINAFTTSLSTLHVPGGSQLNRSLQYWIAYEEGDEEYFDIWEFLITGPREDEE